MTSLVSVQVFEGTCKDRPRSWCYLHGRRFQTPGEHLILVGRILDGAGRPRDGGPEIVADEKADIIGAAINPYSRQ